MRMVTWLARVAVVPVVGLALLAWWGSWEEAQADQHMSEWAALIGFGALACSWAAPRVAIAGMYGMFLLQLIRIDCRFDQAGWIADIAVVLAAIVIAIRVEGDRRRYLVALLPLGLLIGLFTNVPALGPSIPTDDGYLQVGQVNGAIASGPFASSIGEIALGAIAWTVGATALIVAGWMIGSSFHARRIQWAAEAVAATAREELSDSRYELRVSEERDRIAQDVHDITAHSLSVIVAQADGAAAQTADPASRTTLTAIAGSARSALTEIRTLLENLEHPTEGDTGYTVDDIPALIEATRAAGRGVGFERRGTVVPLPIGSSLAAYRITQEALTNAVRHGAETGTIRVSIDHEPAGVALTISSPLRPGRPATDEGRIGRGVIGMQQRARLVGGWLSAGLDPDEGAYVVTAYLPRRPR